MKSSLRSSCGAFAKWVFIGSCAWAMLSAAGRAQAQEFSLLLKCEGAMETPGAQVPAFIDFALRFNGRQVLVQRSNILPAGRMLGYAASESAFTMVLRLAPEGTRVFGVPGWLSSTVLVLHPNLKRMNQIRIGIDRLSGRLDGEALNEEDERLTSFTMECRQVTPDSLKDRKF